MMVLEPGRHGTGVPGQLIMAVSTFESVRPWLAFEVVGPSLRLFRVISPTSPFSMCSARRRLMIWIYRKVAVSPNATLFACQ